VPDAETVLVHGHRVVLGKFEFLWCGLHAPVLEGHGAAKAGLVTVFLEQRVSASRDFDAVVAGVRVALKDSLPVCCVLGDGSVAHAVASESRQ
jgi:hypothetical protein